jgi:5-carboxymethyl-2-hydroxymuconate isomerase
MVLEYSANVPDDPDCDSVLARLHEALCATGPFDLANVRSRVIRHERFRVADGAPDRAFVHLTVAVLEGRDAEILQSAAGVMLGVLREMFPRSHAERRCDFTLEVHEMPRHLYFKSW